MDMQAGNQMNVEAQSPSIELPKGGGALKGITSDFSVNQVTGAASLSIQLPFSSARGFQPDISVAYDSGSGNTEFGLGWRLEVPSVSRRIDKKLPTYNDKNNEDVYAISGLDDLVPYLDGTAVRQLTIELQGIEWEVTHYRPRIESSFQKIERWREPESNRIWWRSVSADNITTVYGYHDSACIFEPTNRAKTYRWLVDFIYDDKGHVTKFVYKPENLLNVDVSRADERHRTDTAPTQVYLKKILYGIKESRLKSGLSDADLFGHEFGERDFHFQTVLDYGDHPGETPGFEASDDWPARQDPFSDYRPGFEVRTYRLCHRVLLFHDFPELGEVPALVSSLNFQYQNSPQGYSLLQSIQKTGYKSSPEGLETKSLPKMEFEYQEHAWNYELHSVDNASLADMPAGIEGSGYQWVDLYGEGLAGLVTESSGALRYKANQGGAKFATAEVLAESPSTSGIGDLWAFQGIDQSGVSYLVSTNGVAKGYYAFDGERDWSEFITFQTMPNLRFDDPNLRMIDLNGDGKLDLLITDEEVFRWHASNGERGFDESSYTLAPHGGGSSEIIFSNNAESIFIADMTGDGLSDIVRVRNGSVVYWPNLGYGRFGKKVTMSDAPTFDYEDQFEPGSIRLTDIDGSGPADIVYLGQNRFDYWLNCCGNRWVKEGGSLNPFPNTHQLASVSTIDLLGAGTSCVVWSSGAPNDRHHSIRYVDLMGGKKPHLLKNYHNGFGARVALSYTPSTHFYLQDKAKGQPWITKLHFPVHCLSRVETIDAVAGTRFASSYAYHHGYYDRAEREFRGFGRVDQIDTEEFDHFVRGDSSNVVEQALHQTPVLTKTWFHVGAYLDRERIINHYHEEYFDHPMLRHFSLPEPQPPDGLSAGEWREALRACKGMALRSEVYGLDATDLAAVPFSVSYNTCEINRLQAKGAQKHAVFQVLNTENISMSLDRRPEDPRVAHQMVLGFDAYGRPTKSAALNYGRNPQQAALSDLPDSIKNLQTKITCVVSENAYTQDEFGSLGEHRFDQFEAPLRLPASWRSENYEYGIRSWHWQNGPLTRSALRQAYAVDRETNQVEFLRQLEGQDICHAREGEVRLLSAQQSRFANHSLDGELEAGRMGARGISWRSYQLAFTSALVQSIYADKVAPTSLQGGYIDLEGDGSWWVPSGTQVFNLDSQPLRAQDRFFLPYGAKGSMGAYSWTDLDGYLMLPISSSVSRAGDGENPGALPRINQSIVINDYRTLSATHLRDANLNWSAVETDALGLVLKSAVMGKVEGAGESTPPPQDAICEGDNLQNPSAQMSYGFYKAASDEGPLRPSWVKTRTYTKHFFTDNRPREELSSHLDFIDQFEYSDGSGNVVMVKNQTTPGLAKRMAADGAVEEVDTGDAVRWIGNGRTIINNKGNPVKQYEPYFSVTHEFEDNPELVEVGITPILFYDAAGRNVCKLNPNKTYEKVVFDAWQQKSWDVNDSLFLMDSNGDKLTDIRLDQDVGHFFSPLEKTLVLPSWYQERIQGKGETEAEIARHRRAAEISEAHAQTPSTVHTDSLGRTIYASVHNRLESKTVPGQFEDHFYNTQTSLDVEGNMLSVTDARGNTVMRYRYNMLPPPDEENPKPALYQSSMDGGEKWTFFDIQGKAQRSWDSRDHEFESLYDSLQRPIASRVKEEDGWKTVSQQFYVDSDSSDSPTNIENNLIGQVAEAFDQSGRTQLLKVDFKGNVLQSKRTLAQEYKQTIDWYAEAERREEQLEPESFFTTAEYDALSRTTLTVAPHHDTRQISVSRPQYNESGALDKVLVSAVGETEKIYVESIEYDAKGQRQSIQYGNGLITSYYYEDDTYRLKQLITRAGNVERQNLSYTYDPVGNITEIYDAAQSTTYFDNVAVEPHSQYLYDALYRLVSATGREHAVQANCPNPQQGFFALSQGNHNELQRYAQSYEYDAAGNIEEMSHTRFGGNNQSNSGWTRTYETASDSNRLLATTLSCAEVPTEHYGYNARGSITSMAHLPTMDWDYAEQLRHVDLQGGGDAYYVYDVGGERTRKIVETNGSLVKERIYLGGWELYRERNLSGLQLERETLHVMDDQRRIALVETKTVENNGIVSDQPVIRYQLDNHLGSACWEIGENLELISYEESHPYGTTAYHTGTAYLEQSAKRYRYTGKERDEETGFSYHGARYYKLGLSRWISVDRKDEVVFGSYEYSFSNPVNFFDPSGNEPSSQKTDISKGVLVKPDLAGRITSEWQVDDVFEAALKARGTTYVREAYIEVYDPKTKTWIRGRPDFMYLDDSGKLVVHENKISKDSSFTKNQKIYRPLIKAGAKIRFIAQATADTLNMSHATRLSGGTTSGNIAYLDRSSLFDQIKKMGLSWQKVQQNLKALKGTNLGAKVVRFPGGKEMYPRGQRMSRRGSASVGSMLFIAVSVGTFTYYVKDSTTEEEFNKNSKKFAEDMFIGMLATAVFRRGAPFVFMASDRPDNPHVIKRQNREAALDFLEEAIPGSVGGHWTWLGWQRTANPELLDEAIKLIETDPITPEEFLEKKCRIGDR